MKSDESLFDSNNFGHLMPWEQEVNICSCSTTDMNGALLGHLSNEVECSPQKAKVCIDDPLTDVDNAMCSAIREERDIHTSSAIRKRSPIVKKSIPSVSKISCMQPWKKERENLKHCNNIQVSIVIGLLYLRNKIVAMFCLQHVDIVFLSFNSGLGFFLIWVAWRKRNTISCVIYIRHCKKQLYCGTKYHVGTTVFRFAGNRHKYQHRKLCSWCNGNIELD